MRIASRFSPLPARRTSGGPVTVARAVRSPLARRSAAIASAASGRTSERAPESRALGDDRGCVAPDVPGLAAVLLPGLADDLADRPFHRGHVIEEPAVSQ